MIKSILTFLLGGLRLTLPAFMRKWKWELWSIPFLVAVFFLVAKIIRTFEPTAGVYDAGVLQQMFLSAIMLFFGCMLAWVLIRAYFPEMWKYTESEEFKDDFNLLNQKWRIIIVVTIFLVLVNAFVHLAKGSERSCVVQTAMTQIEVREATGNNDGSQVEKYLSGVNLKKGYPWCAAFCAWCYQQCGLPHPSSGYCPDWFKTKSNVITQREIKLAINKRMPLQGKVFGLFFPNKNRIAHVGIIDKVDGDYIITIEGNTNQTGSREGDGVYRKRRLISQIHSIVSPT
jgi:hypothetical protein